MAKRNDKSRGRACGARSSRAYWAAHSLALATASGLLDFRASAQPAAGDSAMVTSPPAAQGAEVFSSACVACHGEDGRGGHGGGAPLDQVRDPLLVAAMVRDGRGNMPPLGQLLTAEQINAVAAYVVNELFQIAK